MAGALSKIRKVGQAAEKAAEKAKGLGERAAEAKLKGELTARDRAIIEAAEASKRGFLNPSKEQDVWYHGTREDIKAFKPGKSGAVFVTKDPVFAGQYAPTPGDLLGKPGFELRFSPNIMPLRVQVQNPFDYENPEHIKVLADKLNESTDTYGRKRGDKERGSLASGNWETIESPFVQKAIRDLGFDSFYIKEQGQKNLGIHDPKKIKSAIGMQGSYDINEPEITKAEGGAIDGSLKKWFASGGHVSPEVIGGGTGIPLKKGGAVDHGLKQWFAAQGGSVDSYQQAQAQQARKASELQAYQEGKVGADELIKYYPGMSAAMVESQLNPEEGKKRGGEVKMAGGGEMDFFMEAIAPNRESKSDPRVEAAGVIGKSMAKSMVSPLIGIYESIKSGKYGTPQGIRAGEAAMEKFMAPGDISPEAQPYVEKAGKFMEELETKYKIPPIMPEIFQLPTQGLATQARSVAGKVADRVSEVPPLPVGLSMEAVGKPIAEVVKPEAKKAPANALGLYSPAEKAVLNMQRKQGSGDAFLSELKKAGISNDELEFSGLNDFLKGKKALTRDDLQNYVSSNKIELVEEEFSKGDHDSDEMKFSGEVVDDDNYIYDHAIDVENDFDNIMPGRREEIREEIESRLSQEELDDPVIQDRIQDEIDEKIRDEAYNYASESYYENPYMEYTNDLGYTIVGNDDMGYTVRDPNNNYVGRDYYRTLEAAEGAANENAIDRGMGGSGTTQFHDYQLDGGSNYRELLVIAPRKSLPDMTLEERNRMIALNQYNNTGQLTDAEKVELAELRAKYNKIQDSEDYTESHWSEPNVLLHMRVQDRTTLDGKPMLYVDEMQSDWHQQGSDLGYRDPQNRDEWAKAQQAYQDAQNNYKEKYDAYGDYEDKIQNEVAIRITKRGENPTYNRIKEEYTKDPEFVRLQNEWLAAKERLEDVRKELNVLEKRVPDAPFKENWHELGVKRILNYAAKNGYDRVGFSAASPQIKRWGTQEIAWERVNPAVEFNQENFLNWAENNLRNLPKEEAVAMWQRFEKMGYASSTIRAFKSLTEEEPYWTVSANEQRGGIAGRINLEEDARARGVLRAARNEKVTSQEDLRKVVDSNTRGLSEKQIDRITKKTWDKMQKQDVGVVAPREEGMRFFYDNKLKKFAEKYAKKMGGEFYESQTSTGRGLSSDRTGYVDVTEPVYVIELTPKLKDSAVKGQPYKKGGLVTQPKGWKLKHMRPCKDFKAQKFARGGAVRMQAGGDPVKAVQEQLAAGVPVFMSQGPEGAVARQIIADQEAETRRKEEERKARVAALPLKEKARGVMETGQTLQSVLGQELLKPFRMLTGGEESIKAAEERTPLPTSEAGVQYLSNVGEFLEPVGKAFEASKLPEVPFLPETGITVIPGIKSQLGDIMKRLDQQVSQALPQHFATPPVGAVGSAEKIKVPADRSGFYSPTEKAAVNLQRKQGTGQVFLNDLMKQPDVKKNELEATGLAEWLKTQPNVTKDDVIDYINNNRIVIEERMRGEPLTNEELSRLQKIERAVSKGWYDVPQEELDWFEKTKMKRLYSEMQPPNFDRPDLKIEGGSNYRELLLKLPVEEGKPTYTSSHWESDPNTFAHIRMQDATVNGKKTLVIEEIQSDWHQEGRDKGYWTKERLEKEKRKGELADKLERGIATDAEKDEAMSLISEPDQPTTRFVPDAPFKDDWYQIALKRAMKYAADNDYDAVAIVGGSEQADRYALSRKIDSIDVKKDEGGRKVSVETKGNQFVEFLVDDNGIVQESSSREFSRAEGKSIADVVGKAVGREIMKMDSGKIAGAGLDIGGEGMKKYYDEIYPRFLEKQYKKYGVKPELTQRRKREYTERDIEVDETGEVDRFGRPTYGYSVIDPETGDTIAYESNIEEAIAQANKKAPTLPLWVMDVPTKMKADVKKGQPFKAGGAVKKDTALQEWHMAKGGIAKVAKAAEKAAGKAGKRMSREEAEKAGYWHPISETKLAKPIGEYKSTVVQDLSADLIPRKTISIEELQGGVAIPLAGDRAAAGKIIKEIEGVPMDVRLEGGPDFMRQHPGAAWASGKGVLSMLSDRIKKARESGDPIYGVYTAMSPQAVDFNTMMTESILNQLDISGLRKKDIKEFNQAVKAVKGQGGKPKAPNFPGLEDPELREKLITGPGGQRDAFIKAMAKAEFQKKGFPDVAAARMAVTEPELLDIERGSTGFTVAQLDPEAKILEQSGHTTYPFDLAGQYVGGFEKQLPVDVMYPSHFEAKRLLGSTPAGAHKSLELFAPMQYLDQQWLDNAMRYLEMQKKLTGRKKGGLAQAKR